MNPTPGDEARAAFDQLTDDFAGAGVSTGSMFGMPCLKAATRPSPACTATAPSSSSRPRPSSAPWPCRPMREWAQVPLASSAEWPELAEAARAYVAQG